jgi:tetratricopeptide (TPR) repeat protein
MRCFLLIAALVALPALARGSVDPFYDRLYREGLNARVAGEYVLAAKKLRLACFGMLDDPPSLAACVGQLALVEAARGESQALRETIDRLLELERLHQALTKASAAGGLSASDREAIDDLIRKNAAPQAVADIPAFRLLALRMMAPADRRRELDRKIALDPRNPDWRQALAELFYDEKQYAEAAREAQQTLALKPESEGGHCLRGLARAELKDCGDETLADLGFCRPPLQNAAGFELTLCYLGRGDAAAARAVFDRLPPAERAGEAGKSLEKDLVKLEKKAGS